MKHRVTDIQYDTDGEDVDLPKELVINIPTHLVFGGEEEEIDEFISDEISRITGFCHKGYNSKIV